MSGFEFFRSAYGLALILLATLSAADISKARAQSGPGSIFTVARINVRAEAADAVDAKQIALAQGQQQALSALMKRLTGFSMRNRLPQLDTDAVEGMISGMQVRQERNSAIAYVGQLDFNFRPGAVKDILDRFGIPYVADRAPEVLLLPLYLEGGVLKASGPNPWSQALGKVDLANSLTPLKIVPPRTELTADMITKATASPQGMETLSYQYRAQYLVLAIADMDVNRKTMTLKLAGRDAVGFVQLEKRYKIFDAEVAETADRGAEIALNVFEGRWKLGRLATQGALGEALQDLASVDITAQFSGLKEWRSIRERLEKVPGVQNLDVKTVNPRGASISLDFPGGTGQLTRAVAAHGLMVDGGEGAWILRVQ